MSALIDWLAGRNPIKSRFGSMSIAPNPQVANSRIYRVVWSPDIALAGDLPASFTWEFRGVTDLAQTTFRLLPAEGGLEAFVEKAFPVGLAVGVHGKELKETETGSKETERNWLKPEEVKTIRTGWFLYKRAQRTHSWLGNRFTTSASLFLSTSAHDDASVRHLLPEDVGLTLSGDGERWGVDRLLEEGRKFARRAGHSNADDSTAMSYGFYTAAHLSPLSPDDFRPDALRKYVRQAILPPPTNPPDRGLVAEVWERFETALARHLDPSAEPHPEFDNWLRGRVNLVDLLAKRKPELDRPDVRDALSELGWRSLEQVDRCVNFAAAAVNECLVELLAKDDLECFRLAYGRHPAFGYLTLPVLGDRFSLLRPALKDLLDDPQDKTAAGAAVRMLGWYGEIANKRREADVGRTRRGSRRVLPLDDDGGLETRKSSTEEMSPKLYELLHQVIQGRGHSCKCDHPRWKFKIEECYEDEVVVNRQCEGCDFEDESAFNLQELKDASVSRNTPESV